MNNDPSSPKEPPPENGPKTGSKNTSDTTLDPAFDQAKIRQFFDIFKKHNHYDRQQGLELRQLDDGTYSYFLKVEDRHLSSPHVCHGGVISGMMDATLGLTALLYAIQEEKVCSTVEFKINYLGPAHLGDLLQGRSKLEFKGKSLIVTTADIIQVSTQKLIAKGIGTFNLYPLSKKATLYGLSS